MFPVPMWGVWFIVLFKDDFSFLFSACKVSRGKSIVHDMAKNVQESRVAEFKLPPQNFWIYFWIFFCVLFLDMLKDGEQ
jgi:hypothetical protein